MNLRFWTHREACFREQHGILWPTLFRKAILLPMGWHGRLAFYLFLLVLNAAAAGLLGAGILHWIRQVP